MTTAIWWTSRHWVFKLLVAGAVAVGLAVGSGTAYTRDDAVGQALDAGRVVCLFVGPVALSLLWSSLHEAAAENARHLAGWALRKQRVAQALAHLMALGAAAALTSVIAAVLLAPRLQPYPYGQFPDTNLLRAAIATVLTTLGVVAVTTVLSRGRSTVGALSVSAGLVLVHLVCSFSSGVPGSLLIRELWPGTGSLIISEAGRNYSAAQAAVAAAVLGAWMLAAALSLGTSPRSRDGRRPAVGERRLRAPRAMILAATLALVMAAFLPTILSHLPWQASPALMLQRSESEAPDQVTEAFFFALRSEGRDGARRYAIEDRGMDLDDLPGFFARASESESFLIEWVGALTKAEVRADIAAGTYFACLRYDEGWRIYGLSTQRCER